MSAPEGGNINSAQGQRIGALEVFRGVTESRLERIERDGRIALESVQRVELGLGRRESLMSDLKRQLDDIQREAKEERAAMRKLVEDSKAEIKDEVQAVKEEVDGRLEGMAKKVGIISSWQMKVAGGLAAFIALVGLLAALVKVVETLAAWARGG